MAMKSVLVMLGVLLFPPSGVLAVTVNGRTQIGMGYLGAGKVAKLEFRTREELQRLKAETRP